MRKREREKERKREMFSSPSHSLSRLLSLSPWGKKNQNKRRKNSKQKKKRRESSYPPPVVGHQDRRVRDVPNKIIQRLVVRERLVAAVMPDHKERPEHRPLRDPVERPRPPLVHGKSSGSEPSDDGDVPHEVSEGLDGVLLEALGRDGGLDVGEGEGRRGGEGDLGLEKEGRFWLGREGEEEEEEGERGCECFALSLRRRRYRKGNASERASALSLSLQSSGEKREEARREGSETTAREEGGKNPPPSKEGKREVHGKREGESESSGRCFSLQSPARGFIPIAGTSSPLNDAQRRARQGRHR